MRQEPLPIRGLVLLLCVGLLGSCSTGERRANRDWNRLGDGLTQGDVLRMLGGADRTVCEDGHEIWHYSYGSSLDPQKVGEAAGEAFLILTVFGILLLMQAASSKSGGGSLPDRLGGPEYHGPDSQTGKIHFRVVFDPEGRVVEVSGLEPCEE